MAKRRGKARNRQQRRNPQRIDQRPAAAQQPADDGTLLAPTTSGSGAGANDAFERADAEVRASAAPPLASAQRKPKARPADPRITVTGASRLGERAAAEYHYVIRDLRNIGILLIVLAALLAAATVAVNVIGIGRV
ncbi:MAG TPA: hypothetical protein VFH98_01905 [Candidatus Limnocylindria bacterium]|jgi:hypothetical protein|nr:hypothetical protein [Candidatus Limnocylindria bacterium]